MTRSMSRVPPIRRITHGARPDFLRVLSAENRRAARAARSHRRAPEVAGTGVRVLHLRRRRLDTELYVGNRAPPQAGARARGGAARVVHGRQPRGNPRTAAAVSRA